MIYHEVATQLSLHNVSHGKTEITLNISDTICLKGVRRSAIKRSAVKSAKASNCSMSVRLTLPLTGGNLRTFGPPASSSSLTQRRHLTRQSGLILTLWTSNYLLQNSCRSQIILSMLLLGAEFIFAKLPPGAGLFFESAKTSRPLASFHACN